MRAELFLLMGVIGLALAAGHWMPEDVDSASKVPPEPTASNRRASRGEDVAAAGDFLLQVDRICCLRAGQRRQLTLRLEPICRELCGLEDRLWQEVRRVRERTADASNRRLRTRLEEIQQECDRLTARRDAIVSRCLDSDQRLCWLRARLLPKVRRELAGLTFTPGQQKRLSEICQAVLSSLSLNASAEGAVVLRIVRRVYLEVLDARQRKQYAQIVARRESRDVHLARSDGPG